jgi:hypothetical protein
MDNRMIARLSCPRPAMITPVPKIDQRHNSEAGEWLPRLSHFLQQTNLLHATVRPLVALSRDRLLITADR